MRRLRKTRVKGDERGRKGGRVQQKCSKKQPGNCRELVTSVEGISLVPVLPPALSLSSGILLFLLFFPVSVRNDRRLALLWCSCTFPLPFLALPHRLAESAELKSSAAAFQSSSSSSSWLLLSIRLVVVATRLNGSLISRGSATRTAE